MTFPFADLEIFNMATVTERCPEIGSASSICPLVRLGSFGLMLRIVMPITSENNPNWSLAQAISGSLSTLLRASAATLLGHGTSSWDLWGLILTIRKVYALPPKKARVDRPCARSEKCQGGTEGSE